MVFHTDLLLGLLLIMVFINYFHNEVEISVDKNLLLSYYSLKNFSKNINGDLKLMK